MTGLDRDRGCVIRYHNSGMRVAMYYDAPGEYYDEMGNAVTDAVAAQAGFDVIRLRKEQKKMADLNAYRKKLDSEYAEQEELLAKAMSEGLENLEVRSTGGGQFAIFNGDTKLTKFALDRAEAEELISAMTGGNNDGGDKEDAEAQAAKPSKEKGGFFR